MRPPDALPIFTREMIVAPIPRPVLPYGNVHDKMFVNFRATAPGDVSWSGIADAIGAAGSEVANVAG
jgi:hypothetical protein